MKKFKKSKTQLEKIEDAFIRTNNLHPRIQNELRTELLKENLNGICEMKSWIIRRLNIPAMGIHTKPYWIARGWSEVEAYSKSKNIMKNYKKTVSPYSKEFWMGKINPKTKVNYTEIEADFQRNSRRPIRKEYWIKKGLSEEEAIKKAIETKNYNNNKGAKAASNLSLDIKKATSHRCIEYWLNKGYSNEEAKKILSKGQTTFSLEKCVEKYGEDEGRKRWNNRQEKWQNTLLSKSEKEINEINRKKSTKINYKTLWKQELNIDGYFYIIQLNDSIVKIGITSKNNILKRYKLSDLNNTNITLFKKSTINHVFQIEQLLKDKYKMHAIKNNFYNQFGWTEVFFDIDVNKLIHDFSLLFENKTETEKQFNAKFK